jgi:protein required for attachment to host cells
MPQMISSKCCVLVADGTRARFLTLEPAQSSKPKSGPPLVEKKNLINPNLDIPGRDLWSDPKTGRGRAAGGGPAHGYDDHRDQHKDEFERRFARQIAEETASFVHNRRDEQLVVAAQKRMLGFLRPELKRCLKEQVRVRELAKDFSKLNPTELYKHLAELNLVPRRGPQQLGVRTVPAQDY